MEILLLILILLGMIGISNIINHFLPFISVPLIQIALGILIAVFSPDLHIVLDPELFFVLFIAPLLFNDGKRVPREELWSLRAPILFLALGLVFITVFVIGYAIHWMIPSIPLPAAFALAAILSPTDAVAVTSIAGRIHLPKNIMHLLEGEALMNDASGLVAFKFAIAATVTGLFSFHEAIISFLIIALGGLAVGALTAFLIVRFRMFLRRLGMEDVTMHMLIQLLTPFAIYILTEHLGLSGILAVVAAGIMHAVEQDRIESASSARMRIVSSSTWSVVLFILNGLVFVILGLEIPDVVKVIWQDAAFNNFQVVGYIIFISLALILLRFVWIIIFSEGSKLLRPKENQHGVSVKSYILTALSGVRGAVTLAGAFSIPLVIQDGTPFPERNLIIFLSAGVILFTLLIASFVLPLVARNEETAGETGSDELEQEAKVKLIQATISAMKEEVNGENKKAALSIISDYKKLMIDVNSPDHGRIIGRASGKMEVQIRLLGLQAEKKEVQKMLDQGMISPSSANHAFKIMNHTEVLLTNQLRMRITTTLIFILLNLKLFIQRQFYKKKYTSCQTGLDVIKNIKIRTSKAAIEAINMEINDTNRVICLSVIARYNEVIQRLEHGEVALKKNEHFEKAKKDLQYKALQIGRDEIQTLYENGEISRETASKLRHFVNQIEAMTFEEESIVTL